LPHAAHNFQYSLAASFLPSAFSWFVAVTCRKFGFRAHNFVVDECDLNRSRSAGEVLSVLGPHGRSVDDGVLRNPGDGTMEI
jgi:hypothetical protein